MERKSPFRLELEEAVSGYHTINHPLYVKWSQGELSKACMMGTLAETYHWITNLLPAAFLLIASKAPQDVVDLELENLAEEFDPQNPHPALFLRFVDACGYDSNETKAGRGLPSTNLWCNWQLSVCREQPWQAGVAATHVGSEFQAVGTMTSILPALREKYKFSEHDIEHFWLHGEVDVKHSGSAMESLERHCTTREDKDMAVHYVADCARLKWFFTDCIYLHYEHGAFNQPQKN